MKNPPTAWADLWRPEFKGRIVLPEISHPIGSYIIPIGALAQGKSPKDEAAGLRDAEEDGGPASDLGQGHRYDDERDAHRGRGHRHPLQVADLYGRRAGTRRSNGCTRREGGIAFTVRQPALPENTKNLEAAEEYLNVTMDPERAAFAAKIYNYGGTNKDTLARLSPELQERVKFPQDQIDRMVKLDLEFMGDNRAAWVERWNKVVAGS